MHHCVVVHCTDLLLLLLSEHLLLLLNAVGLLQVGVRVLMMLERRLVVWRRRVVVLRLLPLASLVMLLVVRVLVLVVVVVVVRRLNVHQLRWNPSEVLVFLLEFHAPVLEPDLDLPLGQQQIVRYLDASPSSQVPVVMELLLKLESLEASVRGPLAFGFAHRVDSVWIVCVFKRVGGWRRLVRFQSNELIGYRLLTVQPKQRKPEHATFPSAVANSCDTMIDRGHA